MLKIIMKSYLAARVLTPTTALESFKRALDLYLQGDSGSHPNQLYLIKVAGEYFYGKPYQAVVDAIKSLDSVTTEKEPNNEG